MHTHIHACMCTHKVRELDGQESKSVESAGIASVALPSTAQPLQHRGKREKEHRVYSVAEYLRKLGVPWPGVCLSP